MRLFLLVILASLMISACGQKGPLYKPVEMKDNKTQAQANKETKSTLFQKNQRFFRRINR